MRSSSPVFACTLCLSQPLKRSSCPACGFHGAADEFNGFISARGGSSIASPIGARSVKRPPVGDGEHEQYPLKYSHD